MTLGSLQRESGSIHLKKKKKIRIPLNSELKDQIAAVWGIFPNMV